MNAIVGDLPFLAPSASTRSIRQWRSRLPDNQRFFNFRLAWNTRGMFWTLDCQKSDGSPLWYGVAVRTGAALNLPFVGAEYPLGQIWCEDTEGLDRDPDRTGFATYARLIYRPADIVASVAGTANEIT